jgi:protein-S-isoprenylcysteine O-methyltransferase Ste14
MQVLGWLVFTMGTITFGIWLRKHPGKKNAENTSRILHFLFWISVVPPTGLGFFFPGLLSFDKVLGLSPLPRSSILPVVGMLLLLIGVYFFAASNIVIRLAGKGGPAFLLTKDLVTVSIYKRTRNPMSLGLYLGSVGMGLLIGSTYWTLGALIVAIPAHIFYLKFFEELELGMRMEQPYKEYKQRVPFLLPKWDLSRKGIFIQ